MMMNKNNNSPPKSNNSDTAAATNNLNIPPLYAYTCANSNPLLLHPHPHPHPHPHSYSHPPPHPQPQQPQSPPHQQQLEQLEEQQQQPSLQPATPSSSTRPVDGRQGPFSLFTTYFFGHSNAHSAVSTTSTNNSDRNGKSNGHVAGLLPTTSPLPPNTSSSSTGPTFPPSLHAASPAAFASAISATASFSSSLPSSGFAFQQPKLHCGSTPNPIDIDAGPLHHSHPLSVSPPPIAKSNSNLQLPCSKLILPGTKEGTPTTKANVDNSPNLLRQTAVAEDSNIIGSVMYDATSMDSRTGDLKENEKAQEDKSTLQSLKDEAEDLKADLSTLRKCVTCVICQNLLFEPYSLGCGHIFCYMCLVEWFHQKKTCPECRATVDRQPAPAYLVRDMIETFVARAELTSPHEAGAELRRLQKEALQAVEKDKASSGNARKGGLFQGLFSHKFRKIKVGVKDRADGLLRCPDCNWEVFEGICEDCGQRVRDPDDGIDDDDGWSDEDLDEDDLDDEDTDSMSSGTSDEDDDDDSVMARGEAFVNYLAWDQQYEQRSSGPRSGDRSDPITIVDDPELVNRHEDNDEDDEVRGPGRRRNNASGSRNMSGQVPRDDNRRGLSSSVIDLTRDWEGNRFSARNPFGRFEIDEETDDEEDEEDDEGSLDGFIADDHEDPHRGNPRRRRTQSTSTVTTDVTTVTASSAPSSSTGDNGGTARRRNRRTVPDDDDDDADNDDMDDESNVSEVSPRGRHVRFRSMATYSRRRGPIALSSDNDEDEEDEEEEEEEVEEDDSMLGYTPLGHETEGDEDYDMEQGPQISRGRFGSNTPSGRVTFPVTEESEEDDRDIEGDVNMGGASHNTSREPSEQLSTLSASTAGNRRRRASTPTTSSATRRTRRATASENADTDSDDSEPEPSRRPTLSFSRSHITSLRHRSSYSNHRRSSAGSRRDIDPGISQMLRRHVQQRAELEYDRLANFSSSTARSATPVPLNPHGNTNNNHTSRAQSEVPSTDPMLPPGSQSIGETSVQTSASISSTLSPQSPRTRATSSSSTSQTSSSSQCDTPFSARGLSGIASYVASSTNRSSSMPAVTPPPPRTTIPARSSSAFANTTNVSNNEFPQPNSNTAEQSQRVRPLHYHRDNPRPPATSPQSPPPAVANRSQGIAQRRSRNQLRGAGSRQDLRERRSRNELRNMTLISTITQANTVSNAIGPNQYREATPTQSPTSLVDTVADGASTRQPSAHRVRRLTPEEIREMGTLYMSRRLSELRQQQISGIPSGSDGTSSATGMASRSNLSRPSPALSHLRALSSSSDSGTLSVTTLNQASNAITRLTRRQSVQQQQAAQALPADSNHSGNVSLAITTGNTQQLQLTSGTGRVPSRRLGVGIGNGNSAGGGISVFGTAQQED